MAESYFKFEVLAVFADGQEYFWGGCDARSQATEAAIRHFKRHTMRSAPTSVWLVGEGREERINTPSRFTLRIG